METVEVMAMNGDAIVFRSEELGVGELDGCLEIKNNETGYAIGKFPQGQWVYFRRYGEKCGVDKEER